MIGKSALVDRLRRTRPDYDAETKFHEFLFSAYSGGGGFRIQSVPTPSAPPWGKQAYEYSIGNPIWYSRGEGSGTGMDSESYIIPFRNEDNRQYADRVNCSVYTNHVQIIVNIINAFITQEQAVISSVPHSILEWAKAVDINKAPINKYGANSLKRAQIVGECWTWFEAVGGDKPPRLRNMWPQQVLDYQETDDGDLAFAKLRTFHNAPRTSPLDDPRIVERITIVTPTTWERYDIMVDDLIATTKGVNAIGRVPLQVMRWDKVDDSVVRGLPQIGTIAQMSRALYNRESEMDNNLRTGSFPQLVMPDCAEAKGKGVIEIGPSNAIVETDQTSGIARYIAPPSSVIEEYRTRCAELIDGMFRAAVLDRNDKSHPETYESKKLRIIQTKARLSEISGSLDEWELGIYKMAATYYRQPDMGQAAVNRPCEFDMEDLDHALTNAAGMVKLPVGPQALAQAMSNIIRRQCPGLAHDVYTAMDKEALRACEQLYKAPATPPAAPVLPATP